MLSEAADPIANDGTILILAYDHGLEHGPRDFESVPETADTETVFEVATHPAVTSIAVQKGIAEGYYPSYEDDVSLTLKLNGTSELWNGEPDSAVNASVSYAADIGADAVGFTVYGGSNNEVAMAEEFRDIQEDARAHDMGIVLWSYPRGQGLRNANDPDTIAYGARLGLEIGADVVKVKYPGSEAAMKHAVTSAAGCKVVMSGGSKTSDRRFLETVEASMNAGAAGLAVGRNVFQRENPYRLLDAIEQVLDEGATTQQALEAIDSTEA